MTNKKIHLDTDFLDEGDDKVTKKQEGIKNHKSYKYLWDKKGVYYEDDWYDEWRNWEKHSHDTSNNNSSNKDTKKTYGFGHVFWVLFIILVIIALFGWFDDKPKSVTIPNNYKIDTGKTDFSTKDNKKTSSNAASNSNEDYIITGQFSCSSYNHAEAWRLSPSSFDKAEIDRKLAELNTIDSWIDKIEVEISSFKLNKSSQSSVNTYNGKIDTYNSLISNRKTKYVEYENLLDSYNASVDKYNAFLEKNCTRRY